MNGGRALGQMGRNAFGRRREISRTAMQELDLQRSQCCVKHADLVHGASGEHLGTESASEGEPIEGGIETGGADAGRGKYRTEEVVLVDLQGQCLAVQVQADAPRAAGTIVGHRDVRPRAARHGIARVDADHVVGRQVNEIEAQVLALDVERITGVADEYAVIAMIEDGCVGEITVFRDVDPKVDTECIAALEVTDIRAEKSLVIGRDEKCLALLPRPEVCFLEYCVGHIRRCAR